MILLFLTLAVSTFSSTFAADAAGVLAIETLKVSIVAADPTAWIDPRIDDQHFQTLTEPSLEGVALESYVQYGPEVSVQFVLADLERRGRRAATAAETLLYAEQLPGEQTKYFIYGLGQRWVLRSPAPAGFEGVVLCNYDGKRNVQLVGLTPISTAVSRVLSFPK